MPLMLDNTVPVDLNDVDDLFGDGVGLSLPDRSHNKPLSLKVDDLRSRGCCQTVAWSKSGTIASITPDGQYLQHRFLRCNPLNGSWDLSKPTTCELVKGSPGIPLVHLEWGSTNLPELAIFDAVGRVVIVSFSLSLNHPFITRKYDTDSIDDANAVVGAHWLAVAPPNQQKPYNVMYGPATKNGNAYQYESSFVHASGPSHPHSSKSALFCVTISGMLKMFWSQNNNRMEETTMELESVNSLDELVTHAALASDKRFLLVAVATSSKQLRLLKIEIQWGGPGSQPDKNPLPQNARLSPSLVEKHLAATTWLQTGPGDASNDTSMAELSHLHVLPSIMDNSGKSTIPPMIVAIRTRAPANGSYQVAQTIIDRWEAVVEPRQNLHPAFEQLGNRRNSDTPEQTSHTRLRKLEPIVINKVLISFQSIQFGKVLVLTMADGTVEYRERFTFEEIYATEDLAKVMSLRQVGWTFGEEGPCQQVAFSPTQCSMIQMSDDGKLRWCKLQYPLGDIGNSNQDAHYSATIAALTVAAASAMWYQANYDDIIAIVAPYTTKRRFIQDWISEIVKTLKIQVDYSEELHHDSLMRNAPLQCCLSIMNSVGFKGETQARSFQGKFALVDLNVRNVIVLITLASNMPATVRDKMSPLDEPEVVEALAGCAKWTLDLLSWLTDCLFSLMNDSEFIEKLEPKRFPEVTQHLHKRNDISLHLLLSSSSRSFLLAACRRIAHLQGLSTRAIEFYRKQPIAMDQAGATKTPNPQLQQAYQKMQHITSSSLIKITEFEKLLNILGSDVRQAYSTFLPTLVKNQTGAPQGKQIDLAVKAAQVQLELGMLLAASPPVAFIPVIKKFFSKDLPAFRALTDPAKLFFANYDLLGVQEEKSSMGPKASRNIPIYLGSMWNSREWGALKLHSDYGAASDAAFRVPN
ncbi:mediator of rna polymerase ii transcription subunit 16 [Trichoderma arundinaceum]|uniref:Mediator of RNA polymerase II transcription subunit 16 n=1 Tax=Trichoderma arundinaceum TaxID=490622 RepID=A0A395NT21_TRIAR|nr:mediator of rna polymerase ii transcription subunit 16 [Trichoderma arundinaceum]